MASLQKLSNCYKSPRPMIWARRSADIQGSSECSVRFMCGPRLFGGAPRRRSSRRTPENPRSPRDRCQRPHRRTGALTTRQSFALSGDKTEARTAYQDFLALWKDADRHPDPGSRPSRYTPRKQTRSRQGTATFRQRYTVSTTTMFWLAVMLHFAILAVVFGSMLFGFAGRLDIPAFWAHLLLFAVTLPVFAWCRASGNDRTGEARTRLASVVRSWNLGRGPVVTSGRA